MTGQQAVRLIDRLRDRNQKRKLNDLESTIVLQTWEGSSYRSIADRLSYDLDYIKQIAARLWKSLSQTLGENIGKSNIKSVLDRYQASIYFVDWCEQIALDRGDEIPTDLQGLETWMISDRCHSIVFFESSEPDRITQKVMTGDDRHRNGKTEVQQRHLKSEIQSSILQNLYLSTDPNMLMNKIFSDLTEIDTKGNTINCLIVNYYS
jgi:hypothetical protein